MISDTKKMVPVYSDKIFFFLATRIFFFLQEKKYYVKKLDIKRAFSWHRKTFLWVTSLSGKLTNITLISKNCRGALDKANFSKFQD